MRARNHVCYKTDTTLRRVILLVLLLAVSAFVHASQMGVSPSSLNFGSHAVGTPSAPMTVQLTNYSHNQITVTSVSASVPAFTFSGPALPVTLGPGQSMTGTVQFGPANAQTYTGRLVFTFNTGWKASAYLSGTGAQTQVSVSAVPPSITSQPVSRTVTAGQSATFSVAATGTAPFSYQWYKNAAMITGAASSSYTTPATSTSGSGDVYDAVVSNSAGSVTSASATLTVNAAPTYSLSANPPSLAFGSIAVGANLTIPSTLTNTGNANVTISNVTISGAGFGASGVSSGQILAPGQTASLSVTFTPSTNTGVTGSVTITSNATNSPTAISLSGSGVQPVTHDVALSWSPSTSQIIGYNVYRGSASGGPYSKLTSTPVTATSDTDSSVQAGSTYYYTVTSIDSSNMESGFSNEVSAVIP